jgi:CHAD domain
MLEIVDKLIEHFSDQLAKGAFAQVRAGLVRSRKVGQRDRERAMSQAAKSLRQARQRVEKWPKTGHHRGLTIGLKRVFKRGRVKFTAAYDHRTVDSFHEWRKQVKHLLYDQPVHDYQFPFPADGRECRRQ